MDDATELQQGTLSGTVSNPDVSFPYLGLYELWDDLLLHGVASPSMTAPERTETKVALLNEIQLESFPEEVKALKAGKAVHSSSSLNSLSPALDEAFGLIRVGGRLRKGEKLEEETLHPILLSPDHM